MQQNCGSIRRRKEMRTQSTKSVVNSTSSFGRNTSQSWHSSTTCSDEPMGEEHLASRHTSVKVASRDGGPAKSLSLYHSTIPEELAGHLRAMMPGQTGVELSGEELADNFLEAWDLPPVTKQSLSELDIQSIITNIKLRHDVNFDRDLSFRPNVDGVKGQEKERVADKYWGALIAELVLYNRLFHGTPPLSAIQVEAFTPYAQRRIPILFQNVRDVLKSLVPDRDHSRVDEHLDVPMLMQAIERGVCDLGRLADWMAQLLKEHCAPMRDVLVDEMVTCTRQGEADRNLEQIVEGLRKLFGILEAMKLDVANHQIRNLKTLLIEDTVNFEKHYHLDRLVHGRARVNINTAQNWFTDAVDEFGLQCSPRPRAGPCFELEVFTRAVVAITFGRGGRSDFPETFFLDHDRLVALKAEVDDLVMFEVCVEMHVMLARQLGYQGPMTMAIGQQLRTALSAIMGEAAGHGPQQWMINSEALSLEILRQASHLAGQTPGCSFDRMAEANQHLRFMFVRKSAWHASRLEASLLPQILATVDRHSSSSPIELFNSLVSISPSMPPLPTTLSRPSTNDAFAFAHLHPETAKLNDLANRITHIILLHWRVWGPIAYVQEHEVQRSSTDGSVLSASVSQTQTQQSRQVASNSEQEASVPTSMRTGEPLESGQDAHAAHQSLPQ
ncbi:Tcp11-domain-containing protein [Alternaria alternata]|uniref:Tcp11-domain-containing protein n=1 Tax=Alternaria alternata TaxID=5599 RepID=A0A177D598_ALTAL|nr:Tcp11-domain-containing protein [Alternaria alternata]KAH6858709.1 T-complex protein 11-domain-containing protein [Alternaria alternata]OAG14686.1 Tcp11-domain-containing protein [Alternaria alternata]RYN69220.1 hypothetical protein AA0117_g10982 [Alternaria alternata]